jgi:hypothetical protein
MLPRADYFGSCHQACNGQRGEYAERSNRRLKCDWGTGRRCIAGGKVLVDLPPDCFELAVLELNDANAVPACGGTDQHRVFSGGEE